MSGDKKKAKNGYIKDLEASANELLAIAYTHVEGTKYRPNKPEDLSPEELERAVNAYKTLLETAIAFTNKGGKLSKKQRTLLRKGRELADYKAELEKLEKKKRNMEPEAVENKRGAVIGYDPLTELIYVQTVEEGETVFSADELEFHSNRTESSEPSSAGKSLQVAEERIENTTKMERCSDLWDRQRELMAKTSETIEHYDILSDKAQHLLERQADIKKMLVENARENKEVAERIHATEREITQFWIDKINRDMKRIKEKQMSLNEEIDALQNRIEV